MTLQYACHLHFDLYVQTRAPRIKMDGDPNSSLSHPKESESEHPTDVKVTVGDKASRGESVRKLLALLKQHQDALNK